MFTAIVSFIAGCVVTVLFPRVAAFVKDKVDAAKARIDS